MNLCNEVCKKELIPFVISMSFHAISHLLGFHMKIFDIRF